MSVPAARPPDDDERGWGDDLEHVEADDDVRLRAERPPHHDREG